MDIPVKLSADVSDSTVCQGVAEDTETSTLMWSKRLGESFSRMIMARSYVREEL